ncbi:MAG: hypothetical protein ACLQU2_18500 [Candidatus Binataceae bacterium]
MAGASRGPQARDSVEELLRLIETGGYADGPIHAEVGYDDFDLTVALRYQGSLPYIAATQKLPSGMVEEQIFAVGLSGFLSSVVPDRLDSPCGNGACEMTLYFETLKLRTTADPGIFAHLSPRKLLLDKCFGQFFWCLNKPLPTFVKTPRNGEL